MLNHYSNLDVVWKTRLPVLGLRPRTGSLGFPDHISIRIMVYARPNQGKFESWVSGHSATDHPCALQRQACFWLAPPRTAGGFFYPHLNFPGSSCYTFSEPIPQWLFFYFLAFSWLVSGHPTSRLKDGVKVSTSACCGGWSQSLNIRFHFSL